MLNHGYGGSELTIYQCRQCRRFDRSSASDYRYGTASFTSAKYDDIELESPQLLALCLKKIPALQNNHGGAGSRLSLSSGSNATVTPNNIHVVDAAWVWTEWHSMRLRIRLTVRADVTDAAVTVQQRVMVEFIIKFKLCPECNREFTNRVCGYCTLFVDFCLKRLLVAFYSFDTHLRNVIRFSHSKQTWHALVQVRQKRHDSSPRKGLMLLEMSLAKHPNIRKHVLKMDTARHGFDFYFVTLALAQSFASFCSRVVPMRIKTTSKIVSTNVKNNTANIRHTVAADMVPLCREDLIVVNRKSAGDAVGALSGRLCLVTKCRTVVRLVDASPLRGGTSKLVRKGDGGTGNRDNNIQDSFTDLHPEAYWKSGGEKSFKVLLSSQRLIRFVVLDVELCKSDSNASDDSNEDTDACCGPHGAMEEKYALADVEVARESDFGTNDETMHCVTHLGNLLQVGDIVLGYDLETTVIRSEIEDDYKTYFNSSFDMPDVVLVRKVQSGAAPDAQLTAGISNAGNEGKKIRAKSSASKKREKRIRKEEKKMKELEEAAARMGFIDFSEADTGDGVSDAYNTYDMYEAERAFEDEVKDDKELAAELAIADKEFSLQNMKESTCEDGNEEGQCATKESDEVSANFLVENREAA